MNLNCKSTAAPLSVVVALVVAIGGCAKKNEESAAAPTTAPVVDSTAPASASAASAASTAPVQPAAVPPPTVNDERAAAVQAAIAEDAIVSDARGQWAVAATASSTYASDKEPDSKSGYAPMSVTGPPNVERYGDNGNAWTPGTADKGIEWLEVGFAKPVQATQIRVRQSFGPGTLVKIELIEEGGSKHVIWQGVDDRSYPPDQIAWFDRTFEKTSYKVTGARITMATNAVSGWNEIDAVQLLGD